VADFFGLGAAWPWPLDASAVWSWCCEERIRTSSSSCKRIRMRLGAAHVKGQTRMKGLRFFRSWPRTRIARFNFLVVAPTLRLLMFSAARAGLDKNEAWFFLLSFVLTN
jgi:hypothetical protein